MCDVDDGRGSLHHWSAEPHPPAHALLPVCHASTRCTAYHLIINTLITFNAESLLFGLSRRVSTLFGFGASQGRKSQTIALVPGEQLNSAARLNTRKQLRCPES